MTTQIPLGAALFVDAAGSAQMRSALDDVVARQGGRIVTGLGGHVFAIFVGDTAPSAAAQASIEAHLRAKALGLAIKTGVSCGSLTLTEGATQVKAEGPCAVLAERLHKLLPKPGLALIDDDTTQYLAMGLRKQCKPLGKHDIDGVGPTEVRSIDWDDGHVDVAEPLQPSAAAAAAPPAIPAAPKHPRLELAVGRLRATLEPDGQRALIGRSHYAKVRLVHADVSRDHVHIYWEDGVWKVRDMSTNGTFVRARGATEVTHIRSKELPLPPAGALCLGQTFEQDAVNGATTIEFEQT